jgi:rod shape-determining protein MreD
MRWLSFFILAYIALGLQTGLARAMQWNSATPNFVLIAMVFIAINAPREAALLGAFVLGGLDDMTSQGILGMMAFCYALSAAMILPIAKGLQRKHPATQFGLVLAAGVLTAGIVAVHGWVRPATGSIRPPVAGLFYSAIYSAILALILLPLLQRMSKLFRFQRTSRGYADGR